MNAVSIYIPYMQARPFIMIFSAVLGGLYKTIYSEPRITNKHEYATEETFIDMMNTLDIANKLSLIKILIMEKCKSPTPINVHPTVDCMDYVRIDNTDISIECGLAEYIKVAMGRLLETANDLRCTIDQVRCKIKTYNTSLLRHFQTLDLCKEMNTIHKLSSLLDLRYRILIDVLTIG